MIQWLYLKALVTLIEHAVTVGEFGEPGNTFTFMAILLYFSLKHIRIVLKMKVLWLTERTMSWLPFFIKLLKSSESYHIIASSIYTTDIYVVIIWASWLPSIIDRK